MYTQIIAAMMVVPVLTGCDGSSAENVMPMKTATYYTQHLQEANDVADQCRQKDIEKQSSLSNGDYQEWQISNEGVNCQTAISVSEAAVVREFVLKQSRPATVPPTKAPPPSSALPVMDHQGRKIISPRTLAP